MRSARGKRGKPTLPILWEEVCVPGGSAGFVTSREYLPVLEKNVCVTSAVDYHLSIKDMSGV